MLFIPLQCALLGCLCPIPPIARDRLPPKLERALFAPRAVGTCSVANLNLQCCAAHVLS
jgi:hypothetical protein